MLQLAIVTVNIFVGTHVLLIGGGMYAGQKISCVAGGVIVLNDL